MGEVFLAEDTKLDRKVALKFLPKEFTKDQNAKERFKREAKAAAALNHTNIVTIYEINEHEDQTYIAMEYVEGHTLKELITNHKLPITKVLDITTQICQGLSKAHEAGIVHRDIKPQNIIIDKEGRIKILDFGLAKIKGVAQLTKESSTIGTAHYMSPEQTLGKEVDHRTDIWSLGIILYEMLTGELPFKGDYEQAVIYSIINEEPKPVSDIRPDAPKEMEKIFNKTLAKEPSNRYQQTDELIEELKKIKTGTIPEKYISPKRKSTKTKNTVILGIMLIAAIFIAGYFIFRGIKSQKPLDKTINKTQWENSVAVLPFRDFSPKKDQEYFCDGMTDAIIGKLSQLKQLKIISLTSVLQYKNQARNIKKIGQELGVETILEGSIQKEGNKIRVNAQLINVAGDSHLWQNTFDRELKSLFSIQDDISRSIVNALKIELLREEKKLLSTHHTRNMDAYHLYMQGRFFWRKRSEQGFKKSIEFYNQALKVDPDYALAYAGLADTYSVMAWNRYLPQKEGYTKAKTAALKALELNDKLAEAHNSLAYILLDYEWKFEAARQEFERAIQLNPGYANAYHWYARYFVYQGNLDKAISKLKQALELDPLSPNVSYYLAGIYLYSGQLDKAMAVAKSALNIHPDFFGLHHVLGEIYVEKSMFNEALVEFKQISKPSTLFREYLILHIELKQGKTDSLEGFITKQKKSGKLNEWAPTRIAELFGLAGKTDQYFEWLEKAFEQRDEGILYLKAWLILPQYRTYHTDPRFKDLLKRIGLEK